MWKEFDLDQPRPRRRLRLPVLAAWSWAPGSSVSLIQYDGGLIAASVTLGFETHRIDDRIDRGFADDRGDLLAESIVLGEIYRDRSRRFARGLAAPRSCRRS